MAPAAFVRAQRRLADLARPIYEPLLEVLRHSHVLHGDETGCRIGRLSAWLRALSCQAATIYVIRTGAGAHGHRIPKTSSAPTSMALDEDSQGTLVAVSASPVPTHLHFLSFTAFGGGAASN